MRLLLSALILSTQVAISQASDRLLVFAPSSMTDVLQDIGAQFTNQTGQKIAFSFAGTPQLARQLDAGAPADLYITADRDWMDWALQRKLLEDTSIVRLAGNMLVVAVRREVENWADIHALLTKQRFAMAEPDTVPAGRYARQALEHASLWEAASKMAAYGDNVRTTLQRLALGEVSAAIVYATDANLEPLVRTQYVFPEKSHDPIYYWAAMTPSANENATRALLDYLKGPSASAIFAKAGFTPVPGNGG